MTTTKKTMQIIAGGVLLALVGRFFLITNQPTHQGPTIVVIPHHLITAPTMERFYEHLKATVGQIDTVVIVSPNHFNAGTMLAESIPTTGKMCFGSACVLGAPYPGFAVQKSAFPLFSKESGEIRVTKEHGIGAHFTFINNTRGQKIRVIPIVVRIERSSFIKTQSIINQLSGRNFTDKTLIIASVDFSHHVDEPFAQLHDLTSLQKVLEGNFEHTEVDCPNCLLIAHTRAHQLGKTDFDLFARTSVDSIQGRRSFSSNTSHIFGEFVATGTEQKPMHFSFTGGRTSGLVQTGRATAVFFGDMHGGRGIEFYTRTKHNYLSGVVQEFFQEENSSKSLSTYVHRKLYGLDIASANLETAVIPLKECSFLPKSINLRSDARFIEFMKTVGFTVMNFANNHSFDCGLSGLLQTVQSIELAGVIPVGYDRIRTGVVHGQQLALIGLNDTNSPIDLEAEAARVQALHAEGYAVIVQLHRGEEYHTGFNARQTAIAHQLIDSGAAAIIGHHPHVVEPVERYRGRPIAYSLGNFIFDQPFPETLSGMAALVVVHDGAVDLAPVYFNRDPKSFAVTFH